jgi:predicted outer membrane repeat protein
MLLLLPLLACRYETRLSEPIGSDLVPLAEVTAPDPAPPATGPMAGQQEDASVAGVPEVTPPLPPAPCPLSPDPQALAACVPGVVALVGDRTFSNLQQAIDTAGWGGTAVVCPGQWETSVWLGEGQLLVAADPSPGATVLLGSGYGRTTVSAAGGGLEGVTLRGGRGERGGAVAAYGDFSLTCVTAEGNVAVNGDGGVAAVDGLLSVAWSTFDGNEAVGSGGALSASEVQIWDSTFDDNRAGDGGAVFSQGGLLAERSTFTGNQAVHGGAVAVAGWAFRRLAGTDLQFEANQADRGGALWVRPYANTALTLERAAFSNNVGLTGGGALEFASDLAMDVAILDTAFTGNRGGDAGAIALTGWLSPGARLELSLVHLLDNEGEVAGALSASSLAGWVRIEADDLRVWRNLGPMGAASLATDDTFSCDPCDFGAGENDNVPMDATFGDAAEGALPGAFAR